MTHSTLNYKIEYYNEIKIYQFHNLIVYWMDIIRSIIVKTSHTHYLHI